MKIFSNVFYIAYLILKNYLIIWLITQKNILRKILFLIFIQKLWNILIQEIIIKKIKDIYNLSNSEKKLIKNCPEYDFQSLINFTNFQNSDNIISNIINCLDQELNKSNGNESIKNKISDENIYFNEEEKNNKYNEYIKEFEEYNKSIILDLFYGIKEKKLTCINCNKSKYKYEILNVLYFPKEKFTKFYQI